MGDITGSWQALAEAKRDSILKSIPEKWHISGKLPTNEEKRDVTGPFIHQFLDKHEVEITESDAVEIVTKTSSGEWTAVEVTEAFCHRASLAHQLTNCLHETFFEAALQNAKELDEHFAKTKSTKGPLHGLPVSLKDQFHVKGVETTMGYVGWIGTFQGIKDDKRSKTFESEMVRELRNLGAVLYCKTSVPHTLMSGETVNNIIGYTWNPKNRNLASGGSSGGEGALIGLKGSPGGFGTDIGGSIRIPAAFNGLYGVRPSCGRLPYEGMANSMDGQNSILSVVGPLATTARSVKLLTQAVLSQSPWLYDPLVVELPWRPSEEEQITNILASKKPLCFGILSGDGVVGPHPPILRAIDIVTQTLHSVGHKVIHWSPPAHSRGNALGLKTWVFDGGQDVHKDFGLSGEPIAPQVQMSYGTKPTDPATGIEIATVNRDLRSYKKEYMDYWNSTIDKTETGRPVDAFIMPLAPFAAARPQKYTYYGYSSIINVLDYTSVVLPVTNVDKSIDVINTQYQPISDLDKQIHEDYDPEIYHGAHVALQIVGRRFQEEKMLALAEYLGAELEGR